MSQNPAYISAVILKNEERYRTDPVFKEMVDNTQTISEEDKQDSQRALARN
jgi:hypothetical protein